MFFGTFSLQVLVRFVLYLDVSEQVMEAGSGTTRTHTHNMCTMFMCVCVYYM